MGRIRTLALLAATLCACMALLGVASIASAATNPLALDAPENGSAPLVAYDSVSSTTFIAWPNPQGSDGGVDLCVLPSGAAACEGGGPVLLNVTSAENPALTGANTVGLGGLTVLPNGDVVVIGTTGVDRQPVLGVTRRRLGVPHLRPGPAERRCLHQPRLPLLHRRQRCPAGQQRRGSAQRLRRHFQRLPVRRAGVPGHQRAQLESGQRRPLSAQATRRHRL